MKVMRRSYFPSTAAGGTAKLIWALPVLFVLCVILIGVTIADLAEIKSVFAYPLQTSSGNLPANSAANSPQWANENEHRVVILIDSEDDKVMGHAISYSMNITRSFAQKNEKVQIEIVANGSGIKLFRADTSPLRQPLAFLREALPDVVYSMCDSSRLIAEQKEGHAIALIPGARLVPFGIGRVVELQEAGWSYIHG